MVLAIKHMDFGMGYMIVKKGGAILAAHQRRADTRLYSGGLNRLQNLSGVPQPAQGDVSFCLPRELF